jgi:hypothetical protein
VKRENERTIKEIKDYLGWLQEAVTPYNRQLEEQVRPQVKPRKDRLLADANMAKAIGLPMKKTRGRSRHLRGPGKKARPEDRGNQGGGCVQAGAGADNGGI